MGDKTARRPKTGFDRVHEDALDRRFGRWISMNSYAKWFSRVVWLGILANFGLALPTLFMPDQMLALFSLPSASPLMWPSFAALLLILLSLFYMPAALRPLYYPLVSWLTVLARLAGVIFFLHLQSRLHDVRAVRSHVSGPGGHSARARGTGSQESAPRSDSGPHCGRRDAWDGEWPADRGKWKMRLIAAALVFVLLIAGVTYFEFFRQLPPPHFASDEEHFLYGSIGTEATAGVPYWIWLVLPRVSPISFLIPEVTSRSALSRRKGASCQLDFRNRLLESTA